MNSATALTSSDRTSNVTIYEPNPLPNSFIPTLGADQSMNGIDLIYWLIGMSCIMLMIAAIRNFGLKSLWFWKGLGILGLCVFSVITASLGTVTIAVWIILYVVPLVGFSVLQQKIAKGRYLDAHQIASGLKLIHPGDGWQDFPDLLQALVLVQSGQAEMAQTILKRYQQSNTPLAQNAMITMFRIERRWQDCLNWIEALPRAKAWVKSPQLLAAYCRSLGELQQYPRLFELLDHHWSTIQQQPRIHNQLILLALAYSGQWQGLQNFLQSPRNRYLAEAQDYWLATAAMTGGHIDFAQTQFQQLRDHAQDDALRHAAQERLRSPLKPSRKYLPKSLDQKLAQFAQSHPTALNRYDFAQRPSGLYWVTWVLIIANVVMFCLEFLQGGTEDTTVLYTLGGLWPPDVWAGEYWRLIAANFLHSGVMHIALNMAGLLVLGPFIERTLGWFKFLMIYSASGIGAAVCIAYMPIWFNSEPEFTVGASGAIMGLVGAIAAVTLWGWVVDKALIAARRFRTILLMIGIQVAFDFSTPQISITGHLSGMVIGFGVTLLVIALFGFKEPSRRSLGSVN